jgi:DNA-binding GntR family transcriptional regulator
MLAAESPEYLGVRLPLMAPDMPDTTPPRRHPASSPSSNGLLAERAYLELRDRIVTLRLPPGAAVREDELMRELGFGRTPLREAIKRLALESLVAVQPRRGTSVTDVDAAGIVHIAEVRADLEGQAAELAARRMDAAARVKAEALRQELEAIGRASDQDELMRMDERIHRFVWEASRNPYLADTLDRFYALSLRIWHVVLDRVPGLATAVHDHAQLLEAVLAHDAAQARTLMRQHVLDFQREILAAFSRR